ncbi:MAG: OmpA family protein [Crocinitomicaceae bacterium]|nr:OmpA family protein [Crocinitomicaceae bacterium]NGF76150.1 OmpA family protein [Fluviicola sp. SGL-29]
MKKSILILAIGTSVSVSAQNLIKNHEFNGAEKTTYRAQINKADGWSNANGGSVDLFQKDACKTSVGIPHNFMGEQASEANYAGFTAFYDDQRLSLFQTIENREITDVSSYSLYSEYLQGELTDALIAGQTYIFSLEINLADKSGRAVKGLGVYFSKDKVENKNNKALSLKPQVVFEEFIEDKANWVKVTGSFVAQGGERFFVLGAFDGTYEAKSVVEPKKENDNKRAYYYVNGTSLMKFPLSKDEIETLRRATEMVFFNTGSAVIKNESHAELDKVAEILKKHTQVEALVEGHTDNTGSDELNMKLSKDRAKAVKDYLVSKGVDANRLKSEGYGPTRPIADNSTDAGRAKNRRVVIKTSIYKESK